MKIFSPMNERIGNDTYSGSQLVSDAVLTDWARTRA